MEEKERQDPTAAGAGSPAEKPQAAAPETGETVTELAAALAKVTEQKEHAVSPAPEEEAPPPEAQPEPEAEEETPDRPKQSAEPARDDDGDDEEMSEEERRRVAEMTRTVQVSIEQIMARAAEAAPDAAEAPEAEEEPPQTLGQRVGGGVLRLLKWLMLVVFLVLVIAGAGIAWLYRGATPDTLPQLGVTVGGQEVPAAAYDWQVPVVGNVIRRTYADTLLVEEYELPEPLDSLRPAVTIQPSGLESALTVQDDEGQEVFSGSLDRFKATGLPGGGSYRARLTLTQPVNRFGDGNAVSGSQTYLFRFEVNIRPSVRFSAQSAAQGDIVCLRVTNVPEGQTPTLQCDLKHGDFVQSGSSWLLYLPIPCDAQPGSYQLQVRTADYQETFGLTVRSTLWQTKDYGSNSQRVSPYIGLEDTPDEVQALLDTCDTELHWGKAGFVQPFLSSISITLPYGTTEYVGRSKSEIANGTGRGRTATNAVVSVKRGEALIAPGNGRVLLAEDLGGNAGGTVVIEHGAGLKSIFYGLGQLDVKKGDTVVKGQSLGKTGGTVIAEVRVGEVPVEPFAVWRGQCDAVKNY